VARAIHMGAEDNASDRPDGLGQAKRSKDEQDRDYRGSRWERMPSDRAREVTVNQDNGLSQCIAAAICKSSLLSSFHFSA
jgi:hypothetical protein